MMMKMKFFSITAAWSVLLIMCVSCSQQEEVKPTRDDADIVAAHNEALPKTYEESLYDRETPIGGNLLDYTIRHGESERHVLESVDEYWVSGNGGEFTVSFTPLNYRGGDYGPILLFYIMLAYEGEDDVLRYGILDVDFTPIPKEVCQISSWKQDGSNVSFKVKFPENYLKKKRIINFKFTYWESNPASAYAEYTPPFFAPHNLPFVQLP